MAIKGGTRCSAMDGPMKTVCSALDGPMGTICSALDSLGGPSVVPQMVRGGGGEY